MKISLSFFFKYHLFLSFIFSILVSPIYNSKLCKILYSCKHFKKYWKVTWLILLSIKIFILVKLSIFLGFIHLIYSDCDTYESYFWLRIIIYFLGTFINWNKSFISIYFYYTLVIQISNISKDGKFSLLLTIYFAYSKKHYSTSFFKFLS